MAATEGVVRRAPEPEIFETQEPLVAEGVVSDNKESNLYTSSLVGVGGGSSASAAFQKQIEAGRIALEQNPTSFKEALEKAAGPSRISKKQTEYELVQSRYKKFESPLQRFQRLQIEIAEFQKELEEVDKEAGDKAIDQGVLPSELLGELSQLQTQLQNVWKSEKAQQAVQGSLTEANKDTTQQKLSESLIQELQNLSGSKPSASTPAAGSENVTYELYYRPGIHNGKDAQLARLYDLEKRLSTLELALSGQSKLKNPLPTSVLAALEELERKVSLLDETKLEVLKVKLQNLTFGMEDALLKNADSPKTHKVEQLYDLLMKWDGTWQQLPVIVSRLQALRRIHEQCAAIGETISKLEREQTQTTATVNANAQFLQQLQSNLQTNLATMNENLNIINQRIEALSKSK